MIGSVQILDNTYHAPPSRFDVHVRPIIVL